MSLPVGVVTRPLSFGRPFDALGNTGIVKISVVPVFGGTAQRLVWAATGDPFEAFEDTIGTDPDGDETEAVDLPAVNQSGWLDGSGNTITGWSYRVTVTPAFIVNGTTKKLKSYTKLISPLTSWSPSVAQDFDLLPDGTTADPVIATPGAVTNIAGLVGPTVTADSLSAALGGQLLRFVYYGTNPNVARLSGSAPVFWIGDPSVEPVNQVAATDFRIPTA